MVMNETNFPYDDAEFPYDDAEIGICLEYEQHDGTTVCERTDDDEATAQECVESGEAVQWMYSVYWHFKKGGVEHVADFAPAHKQEAEILYDAMRNYAKRKSAYG